MMKCESCTKYDDCRNGSGLTWPCGAYRAKAESGTDIEKLIRKGKSFSRKRESIEDELIQDLTTALSTLKTENEKLRAELENYRKGHCAEGGCAAEKDRDLIIAENEKLRAELEQVKRERDAAVSDLETVMAYGGGNLDTCQFCKNAQCYARGGAKPCLPQWRGQKEE